MVNTHKEICSILVVEILVIVKQTYFCSGLNYFHTFAHAFLFKFKKVTKFQLFFFVLFIPASQMCKFRMEQKCLQQKMRKIWTAQI